MRREEFEEGDNDLQPNSYDCLTASSAACMLSWISVVRPEWTEHS